MDNNEILDALRELKNAVEPFVSDDDGMFIDYAVDTEPVHRIAVTYDDLKRASDAWAKAVNVVGRIDRPAQYRPIPA